MQARRALTLLICLALPTLAWRLGGTSLWYANAIGYAVAAALAAWELHQDDQLRAAFTWRSGDASFAGASTAALYVPLLLLTVYVMAPDLPGFPDPKALRYCRVGGAWLPRPDMHGVGLWIEALRNQSCAALAHSSALRGPLRGAAIIAIAVVEEIAWRGGVQQHLSERLGSTRGWVVASLLYALCQLGTGNVSVALVALPAGFLWGALYRGRGRLVPSVLAHAAFSWFFFYNMPVLALHR